MKIVLVILLSFSFLSAANAVAWAVTQSNSPGQGKAYFSTSDQCLNTEHNVSASVLKTSIETLAEGKVPLYTAVNGVCGPVIEGGLLMPWPGVAIPRAGWMEWTSDTSIVITEAEIAGISYEVYTLGDLSCKVVVDSIAHKGFGDMKLEVPTTGLLYRLLYNITTGDCTAGAIIGLGQR